MTTEDQSSENATRSHSTSRASHLPQLDADEKRRGPVDREYERLQHGGHVFVDEKDVVYRHHEKEGPDRAEEPPAAPVANGDQEGGGRGRHHREDAHMGQQAGVTRKAELGRRIAGELRQGNIESTAGRPHAETEHQSRDRREHRGLPVRQ